MNPYKRDTPEEQVVADRKLLEEIFNQHPCTESPEQLLQSPCVRGEFGESHPLLLTKYKSLSIRILGPYLNAVYMGKVLNGVTNGEFVSGNQGYRTAREVFVQQLKNAIGT